MFPKIFESTVYTKQGTICPLDLLPFNPQAPASIYHDSDQPQADYHRYHDTTHNTINSDANRVTVSLTAYPLRVIYDATIDSIDF